MITPRLTENNTFKIAKSAAAGVAALFAVSICQAGNLDLAESLFEEGSWEICLRECRCVLAQSPSNDLARLFMDVCNLRLGRHKQPSIESLRDLITGNTLSRRHKTMAAFECGEALKAEGKEKDALKYLSDSFYQTRNKSLAAKSASSIKSILDSKAGREMENNSLRIQIETVLTSSGGRVRMPAAAPDMQSTGKIGELIVWLYREAISPALGQRCSLYPSCSEYFLRASRKHGLLGFPIQADRFVREPGVVQSKTKPVVCGNIIKYADPLSDHDFWLRNNKSEKTP
ncbi:MAG: membrane protein insertion efficiency factor YidD [Verrucomicrobiota bacterium]